MNYSIASVYEIGTYWTIVDLHHIRTAAMSDILAILSSQNMV